ncbi:MAG: SDR family oxidoreductase [Candidatus Eremiobacteraeota bacterium]|nr:SDR family oxidoreductase [Candidatus Eremiobacteraeota bacterium]
MDLQLKGKRALVSASSGGIGLAIAQKLAQEGAEVILNGRTEATVQQALDKSEGLKFLTLVADLGTAEGVQKAIAEYPQVDILVNNLGIYWARPFEEITDEEWEKILEVNFLSGVRLTRHYFPKMLAQDWGRVLFIASESGIMVPSEMVHYGVTKSAQLSLASGLARLTKNTGVTVNSVLPGPTETENVIDFMRDLVPEEARGDKDKIGRAFVREHRPGSLIGRLIRPEEIASLVTYLASPLAAATNGAAVRAEGGLVQSIL